MVEAMAEANASERLARPCPALLDRQARVQQPARDVVDRRQAVEQVELLEDEPDPLRPHRRQVIVGGGDDVEALDAHLAGGGRSSVPMICSRVVLPEPDGPTTVSSSPASTSRPAPLSAWTPPGSA